MTIQELLERHGKPVKDAKKDKPTKTFAAMTTAERWAVVEKVLKDLGYID